MPLKVMDVVQQRLAVLEEPGWSGRSVAAVCARHGISRETFYTWKRAYEREGLEGLVPRSRRPVRSPGQVDRVLEERIVRLRKEHHWGPRKIRDQLRREHGQPLPAVSTVQQVLARRGDGLVRVRSRASQALAPQRFERAASNELWQIDGAMHRLADGTGFWVVDIVDDHSRFLVGAAAGPALTSELAWSTLRSAVAAHGLPAGLLSDNGLCFTGRLHARTVAFERQVARAGIRFTHSRAYHPQTCGKIERFHQTHRDWLTRQPVAGTLDQAREQLAVFTTHYNQQRPHQALGGAAPAERYQPGPPVWLPAIEVEPADPLPPGALIRHVAPQGTIGYSRRKLLLGQRWVGVSVGALRRGPVLEVYYGAGQIAAFPVGLDLPHPTR